MKGIYVTIQLDKFLQVFLRGKYDNFEIIFKFPRASQKNYIPFSIEEALWYPPKDYKPKEFGEKAFKIELPEMSSKDPQSMNYISDTAMNGLQRIIQNFYYKDWYTHIDKMLAAQFSKTEIINEFIERYSIPEKYRDRLDRDYSRYKNHHYIKAWRKREKNTKKNLHFAVPV